MTDNRKRDCLCRKTVQAVFVLSEVFRKELQDQTFQDKMEFMTEQGRPGAIRREISRGRELPGKENIL